GRMIDWFSVPDVLYGDLLDADSVPQTVVGMELFKAMENTGVFGDIRAVSAQDYVGMENIYASSQLVFFGERIATANDGCRYSGVRTKQKLGDVRSHTPSLVSFGPSAEHVGGDGVGLTLGGLLDLVPGIGEVLF
ncbi:MAG: hypothetical protein IKA98_00315, partial [Candidatus Methanomethylophilaceae archaeon]|nr:hypothetical protein [Candidatus Methanomethylophilaceae archaeon]